MLIVVISTSKLIKGKRFMMCLIASISFVPKTGVDGIENTDNNSNSASLVLISKINSGRKVVVKDKIIEILTRADISEAKEILTKVLLCRVRNINNNINNVNIDKVIIFRGPKGEIGI